MQLYNDDCLTRLPLLPKDSVDFVCVDLPYGQTAIEWDTPVDLVQMWKELKRVCKPDCTYAFFCTTKFGHTLISSNPSWFRYDIVWQKAKPVGFLSANKAPLRSHEMIYIFSTDNNNDLDNVRNMEMREYAKQVHNFIGKSTGVINKEVGNMCLVPFLKYTSTQFGYPTKKTYDTITEMYNLRDMPGYIERDEFPPFVKPPLQKVYNPQKTPGKPYKSTGVSHKIHYNKTVTATNNTTGDRHPLSVQYFKNDKEAHHPTQKPLALCEWLVKTYTNPGQTVLDHTMGSGSTGVACVNTGRQFIGIERDAAIFDVATKRVTDAGK